MHVSKLGELTEDEAKDIIGKFYDKVGDNLHAIRTNDSIEKLVDDPLTTQENP